MSWKPQLDLQQFNRLVIEIEISLLAFLQKEKPLSEVYGHHALAELYQQIDLDPWQAFLYTRIKSTHAMTPRHGINVMILVRSWCILHHKLGHKLNDFSFAALVHDAGHWFHGNLIYEFNRYSFDQANQLDDHCIKLDWDEGVLTPDMQDWIMNHHENYDGNGYPKRRKNPPLLAQMLSIADCFEGLTTKRHFRPAHSPAKAMELIDKWTPYKFNPGLVKSWQDFLGKWPPGTGLIQHSGKIALTLPPDPESDERYQLILTNQFGDSKEETIEPLDPETVKSETVAYFQPPLTDAWKPLRPDTMELPRILEEPEKEGQDKEPKK